MNESKKVFVVAADLGSDQDAFAIVAGFFWRVQPTPTKEVPNPPWAIAGQLVYANAQFDVDWADMAVPYVDLMAASASKLAKTGIPLVGIVDKTGAGQPIGPQMQREIDSRAWPNNKPVFYQAVLTAGNVVNQDGLQLNISRDNCANEFVLTVKSDFIDFTLLPPSHRDSLLKEAKSYARTGIRKRLDHLAGAHDDLISAGGLAMQAARRALGQQATLSRPTDPKGILRKKVFADAEPANPNWDGAAFLRAHQEKHGVYVEPTEVPADPGAVVPVQDTPKNRKKARNTGNAMVFIPKEKW